MVSNNTCRRQLMLSMDHDKLPVCRRGWGVWQPQCEVSQQSKRCESCEHREDRTSEVFKLFIDKNDSDNG